MQLFSKDYNIPRSCGVVLYQKGEGKRKIICPYRCACTHTQNYYLKIYGIWEIVQNVSFVYVPQNISFESLHQSSLISLLHLLPSHILQAYSLSPPLGYILGFRLGSSEAAADMSDHVEVIY